MSRQETIFAVSIVLPQWLVDKIQRIKKESGLEYAGNYNFEPHVTLHLVKINKKDFKALVDGLKLLIKHELVIRIGGLQIEEHNGNLFLSLKILKSVKLMNLHKRIVEQTNKWRGSLIREKDLARIKAGVYNKQETGHIRKYGYLRTMDFFKPHITLGEIANDSAAVDKIGQFKKDLMGLRGKSFKVESLVVGIYDFDIKKNCYINKREIIKKV